ncbi:MAG: nucleoside triphosphate pyrophosphohydrolase [bacterium]|nr:nucleoside triphosphate pyrophosphohydrolase [bacterium]
MSGIQQLLEIMAQLRDPEGGCPWDLEQDFETISPYTIEEAYEVDEAIASGDLDALRDELGDLLFQVVFQARIAEECGAFDFEAVVDAIRTKLLRRHPHVFAGADAPRTIEAQTATWESIKAAEREAAAGDHAREDVADPFGDVPRNLPALARSAKLMGRFASLDPELRQAAGPAFGSELDRANRVLADVGKALEGPMASPDRAAAMRMVGEGLRAWVGIARALGVDAEQALRRADDVRVEDIRKRSAGSKVHQAGNPAHR